jgi:molybdopterin/thiamine biosynthesis adenylyltransferase
MDRTDRNIRFFGKDGQDRLRAATLAVVGGGGLGSHVCQQLAYLGVGEIRPIDYEELDVTNLNRYVTAYADDPVTGTRKVDLCERLIKRIDPTIAVRKVHAPLRSAEAFQAIQSADYIFGCLDNEGSRLVLTELCSAYALPYVDLATEIFPGEAPNYGGRVCIAWDGNGCLVCLDQIDLQEAQSDLASRAAKRDVRAIYGVDAEDLGNKGPSVVSINGVIASLGVTEFMLMATGIREPRRLLTYRGHLGIVAANADRPNHDCYYCRGVRGLRDSAGMARYLTDPQS